MLQGERWRTRETEVHKIMVVQREEEGERDGER